jgi:two-component system sensor histidine kinase UhpB
MKGNPLSILLIEDSPTDAMLLNENLQQVIEFAFEMEHADALGTALLRLAEKTYDAIILDLGLPDSTGIKTFERVRAQAENIPIIILSGNNDRSLLTELMNAGADNYLIKDSVDGNRIAIAILSAIRNRLKAGIHAAHES